jgi:adenine-specific DNA-methyltransferase
VSPLLLKGSEESPPLTKGDSGGFAFDIRCGFVYKRVPHITLKAIANNTEIDVIHARWQEKVGPVLEKLSGLFSPHPAPLPKGEGARINPRPLGEGGRRPGEGLQEWQIPRDVDAKWSAEAKKLHEEFWQLRWERQKEIDASIAKNADTEVLYDQPYEDSKRIRVTGPFTVESLSPHRVLSTDEERPATEREAQRVATVGQFETMIIDNLKKAGVQNTRKNERLKFDRLEMYAGEWLHAAGDYTDSDGLARRVAVCLGPEHGTVGPELIKEAAKEAMKGAGFDLLIVCGFAFDAHAGETAKEFSPQEEKRSDAPVVAENYKQFGKLPVLLARMNPDLAMGDELLKNTGAGNLFMVFGEPDVTIHHLPSPSGRGAGGEGGKIQVEIKGVDVYDPTTGVIRSSSTDEIACWFIDTNYNEESFFVRNAYFTGAGDPYDKLKRALRAEIDEAAWASLYSTVSRPFDSPGTGKIAIKVINHYGDEVLKVFEMK